MQQLESIIGLLTMSVADILFGSMSVWDIWVRIEVSCGHQCHQSDSLGRNSLW